MNLELESYDPMAGTLASLRNGASLPTATRAHASPPTSESEKINIGILALDLGARTGWAMRHRDGRFQYGTQDFRPKPSWPAGQKWQRFRSWLSQAITQRGATLIAYEDVRRHLGVDAAHAYGGYLAMLEMVADQHNVTLVAVGVGTIKKHWTGKGNAKKDEMIAEAKRRGFHPDTDNAADALAILSWAVAQERQS